jgi:3-deoxy-7-phosphoheptulonate synthase
MGAASVAAKLPAAARGGAREGRRVLWVCDPMHGNTESTANGFKTAPLRQHPHELDAASTSMPRSARAWAACTWS